MAYQLDANALLAQWERALGQVASARDDALLQGLSEAATAPRALGERNARLLVLHAQFFGNDLELLSHCPDCATVVQFGADCAALAKQTSQIAAASSPHRLEVDGHSIEFRLPDIADLTAASRVQDDDEFVTDLLARCILVCTRDGMGVQQHELPSSVLDALSHRMDALDPCASVSFSLECPECTTHWDARLDVGQLLWNKLQAAAERILLDVDALAHAYGWTEPEVLRLSPARRAAYLQLVTG